MFKPSDFATLNSPLPSAGGASELGFNTLNSPNSHLNEQTANNVIKTENLMNQNRQNHPTVWSVNNFTHTNFKNSSVLNEQKSNGTNMNEKLSNREPIFNNNRTKHSVISPGDNLLNSSKIGVNGTL
jgi:hypothetical protein